MYKHILISPSFHEMCKSSTEKLHVYILMWKLKRYGALRKFCSMIGFNGHLRVLS